MRFFVTFWKGY